MAKDRAACALAACLVASACAAPAPATAGPQLSGLAGLSPPDAAVFTRSCAGADLFPDPQNRTVARLATACLIDAVRRAAGLPVLDTVQLLRHTAAEHSRDMVIRHYFAHTEPPHVTFAARLRAVGWDQLAGENIAYGTVYLATPRAIVWAWMKSPKHRANILYPGYRAIGVALSLGVPTSTPLPGATYTTDFGA